MADNPTAGVRRGRSLEDFHMRLMRAFHAQRTYFKPRVDALGLGPGQAKVLVYLAVRGPASQREVADYFECDPGAVSRMLDTMERAGLVTSAPGRDRRVREASVTERGLAAADGWELFCDEEQKVMLRGFSPAEREQFADLLGRARANLRAAISDPGPASSDPHGEKNLAPDPDSQKGGDR